MLSERHRLLAEFLLVTVGIYFLTLPWLSPVPPARAQAGGARKDKPRVSAADSPQTPARTSRDKPPTSPRSLAQMLREKPDPVAADVRVLIIEAGQGGALRYRYADHVYQNLRELRGFLELLSLRSTKVKILIRRADGARFDDQKIMPVFRLCEALKLFYYLQPLMLDAKSTGESNPAPGGSLRQ